MTDSATPRLFCCGLGYSARALARRVLARGWRVAGTTRGRELSAELETAGIAVFPFHRGEPLADAAAALAGATHLLSSVPPDGDPMVRITVMTWGELMAKASTRTSPV